MTVPHDSFIENACQGRKGKIESQDLHSNAIPELKQLYTAVALSPCLPRY
jgi:hypothetical protein